MTFSAFFSSRTLASSRARRLLPAGPRTVPLVALLTALMGVVNLLSVTTPALHDRVALLRQVLPLEVRFGSHLAATLSGFALLVLARGLWRRKQTAWLLTVSVLAVSAVSHVLKGLDVEEAALSVGLAAWLLRLRSCFPARSDRPTVQHALWVLAGATAFSFTYGVLGLALLDRHFSVEFNIGQAIRQVLVLWTQFDDAGLVPVTPFGHYFADSLYAVAAVTMGYGLLALACPVLVRDAATLEQRAQARAIVEQWGAGSLAHFALWPDKSYWFSEGGSVVAFAVKRGVCLALGSPIGPPCDLDGSLAQFTQFCGRNDWKPAFVCTEPDTVEAFRKNGFDTLCFGHEAIVDVRAWTLAGGRMKDVRGRVNRLKRLGFETRLHPPPLAPSLLDEMRAVNNEWLAMTGSSENIFSMGSFDDDYLRACPTMIVHAPDGHVCCFANIYPEYNRNEATIDLMRRRGDAENGAMESLFIALFDWAQAAGYDTFNLGLSPLAGVGLEAGDPSAERALHRIYRSSRRFYNFKGLHSFKAKFGPQWSPRYLVYPGPASLPAVAVAVIRAHAGDDFMWRYLRACRTAGSEPTTPRPVTTPPSPAVP